MREKAGKKGSNVGENIKKNKLELNDTQTYRIISEKNFPYTVFRWNSVVEGKEIMLKNRWLKKVWVKILFNYPNINLVTNNLLARISNINIISS